MPPPTFVEVCSPRFLLLLIVNIGLVHLVKKATCFGFLMQGQAAKGALHFANLPTLFGAWRKSCTYFPRTLRANFNTTTI